MSEVENGLGGKCRFSLYLTCECGCIFAITCMCMSVCAREEGALSESEPNLTKCSQFLSETHFKIV